VSDGVSVTKSRGGGEWQPLKRAELGIFLRHLAITGNLAASAEKAGISMPTARAWPAQPEVISALQSSRDRIIRTEGASLGLKVLLDLAGDVATPAHTRLNAARELLALAGHSAAQAATDAAKGREAAALQDMSADQLERMIAGAAATLQQLRRQVTVVDVSPDGAPASADPASLL